MAGRAHAGELDQQVEIQVLNETVGAGGSIVETWQVVTPVWAKVTPVSGSERLHAGQLEASAMYRVTIRRREDLTARHRLVWDGRPLNIRWDGYVSARRPFMTLDCEMGVAS